MIKGDLTGVLPEVLAELNHLDLLTEGDLIVTSGFRKDDPAQHGLGLAVDIVAPNYGGRLLDLFFTAERLGWKGIGIYPTWALNGKVVGGLHLDMRKAAPARWIGTGSGKSQIYLGLTQENLKKLGVIG